MNSKPAERSTDSVLRRMRRLLLSALVSGLACGLTYGQRAASPNATLGLPPTSQPPDSLFFDFNQDVSIQLLPFNDLYQLALAYSPAVNFEGHMANGQQAVYRLAKLQVLQNAGGYFNYSTGNQAILSTGVTGTSDRLGQIANGYRMGVNVSLSLHNLLGRPQEIRLAESNFQAAVARRKSAEVQLRRELFVVYQDLLLAQRVLHIRIRDDQASLAAFRIAEVELQKGKITPEAHAYNSNRYAQSRTTAEQAKTDFIKQIYYLESLVGMPISQLKRK